jgi:hypothetical protein
MITRIAVEVLSGLFCIAGVINLSSAPYVQAAYRFWHYPRHFNHVVGALELTAALFLILPQTRIWGVVASGLIIFGSIVTLLNHRQYLWSLPALLLLAALVPASMAHS